MKKPVRQILRGTDLLNALMMMRPDRVIKMMVFDKVFHINVKQAISTVSTVRKSSFEGEFRNGRVLKIREVDHRARNIHDHKFRDGRACLQFTSVSPKTVDLWDKIFSRTQVVNP